MRAPPLRDAQGKVIPHDHAEILDEHHVIRHTDPHDTCDDGAGGRRLTSGAYTESSDGGMSVDIEEWMVADGLSSLHYVTDPTQGAARINVGELRKLGLKVGWDPDGGHNHHGAVWGLSGSKKRRQVAKLAATLRKCAGES
jgi:hypothetical protein